MSEAAPYTFRAVSYPWRLYAGEEALRQLPDEVRRHRAQRAFVVCGQTVAHKTNVLARVQQYLGPLYAGVFDAMDKDSTWPAVERGTAAARAAGADLLIAIGGGSVIVGTRVIAILLAEKGDPYTLMTQYPAGQPAYSPRLMAPKPPIINVVTTPTTAMNRAGSGLKNDALDHRMEFYDPKTRPVALFWDAEALLTAPPELVRSTATTVFSGLLRALGQGAGNPLVEGDRRQAFHLLHSGLPRLLSEPENAALRMDFCSAALLENRAADDGADRRRQRDRTSRSVYALATALHIRYHHVGQGEATSALMPVVTGLTPPDDITVAARIAQAMGVWQDRMSAAEAAAATAAALETFYQTLGMPTRIHALHIPREELPLLAQDTLKNFNANPGVRSEGYVDEMLQLLQAAW
ncbi:MAG: iron-containing alcohol dehydrogenase [Candidatus Tectimicrobiota bacterium]